MFYRDDGGNKLEGLRPLRPSRHPSLPPLPREGHAERLRLEYLPP